MSSELESFNAQRVCRVCRWPIMHFKYEKEETQQLDSESSTVLTPERIVRTCERCGFVVNEAPAPDDVDEHGTVI